VTNNKRFYPPSTRRVGKKVPYGKMGDNRIAFTRTGAGTIALYRLPNDPEKAESEEERLLIEDSEIGPNYRLTLTSGRFKIDYYLTSLIEEELNAIKSIFELALELAYPITRARDRMAQDAFSDGDDSFTRIYRPAPQFVVRNREATEHDQSILDRSRAAFDRKRSGGDSVIEPGVSGPVLAAVEQERSEAKDHEPTVDELADLCAMDGPSSDVQGLQGTDTSGDNSTPSA
jgi:hypothetical protein